MKIIKFVFLLGFFTLPAFSQVTIDLESGYVKTGYNDIRIPGDTGTLLSLSEDLKADDGLYFRARLAYSWNQKSTLSLLYAPLQIESAGQVDRDIQYRDVLFPAGEPIKATYKFNSYRLSYRYRVYNGNTVKLGIGLTGKIRDADIRLKSDHLQANKKNVGFVPLVHFKCDVMFSQHLHFILQGDAAAAPQGRAEDVLAAFLFDLTDKIKMRVGYRILEGGADNDEVYTFALFHYASFGFIVQM